MERLSMRDGVVEFGGMNAFWSAYHVLVSSVSDGGECEVFVNKA